MSIKLVNGIFNTAIKDGLLVLALPDGQQLSYGNANDQYPQVRLKITDPQFFKKVISSGNLGLGESYMKQYFSMEQGRLHDLLDLLLLNQMDKSLKGNFKLLFSIGIRRLVNALQGKSRNVRRHYDIGFDIFKYMLDENLTYSCGYLVHQDDSLNQLQYQKFQRISDKLQLQPGEHVLDIGCGYGSFLIYAAQNYGVSGIGVTNSRQHADFANQRIQAQGLSDQIQIICDDYKQVTGTFDKIVSIGMLEHVPRNEYSRYFKLINTLLPETGAALVHAVGCNTYKNEHDPFIQKYIFPNSNQPKLSEIATQVERNRMAIIDVENIIRHYRPTAKHWLENFLANKSQLDNERYNDTFYRCWEYYLSCCVSAARYSDSAVYQVLFHKSHLKSINYERV